MHHRALALAILTSQENQTAKILCAQPNFEAGKINYTTAGFDKYEL